MDLKQIRADRATGQIEFMGESMTFKYRPAMVTPKTYHKLQEADDITELGVFFAQLLVSWDLTQGGEPVEITADIIQELPMGLIREMSKEILQSIPQRDVGKDSDDS